MNTKAEADRYYCISHDRRNAKTILNERTLGGLWKDWIFLIKLLSVQTLHAYDPSARKRERVGQSAQHYIIKTLVKESGSSSRAYQTMQKMPWLKYRTVYFYFFKKIRDQTLRVWEVAFTSQRLLISDEAFFGWTLVLKESCGTGTIQLSVKWRTIFCIVSSDFLCWNMSRV